MNDPLTVKPLPYRHRQRTFSLLLVLFAVSLPFLYLYATGYRFDFSKPTQLISTGGIYLAVERTGAEIYIDNELVRETRVFRRAFYAQNIDVGTHRVHVQKEGFHTWVKELPVQKHLVTEAEAFNLPLVPQVRVIPEWQNATGTPVVRAPLLFASTTNEYILASSTATSSTWIHNTEYAALLTHFATTTPTTTPPVATSSLGTTATDTPPDFDEATSTIIANGVKLALNGEDLYATWVGSFEDMPYYYCAADFPPYADPSNATTTLPLPEPAEPVTGGEDLVMHPLQTVAPDAPCDRTIRIDRRWQTVRDFDFYPNSADIVLVALEDGIYAVEIDDRSWQNVQPVLLGEDLSMHLENGTLYVYDGDLIYQVFLNAELS